MIRVLLFSTEISEVFMLLCIPGFNALFSVCLVFPFRTMQSSMEEGMGMSHAGKGNRLSYIACI
jgi:hypothetical protein